MIKPYVYRLDNPITGEFYIGYREANKCVAVNDLGHHYFTSSTIVKKRFSEFVITSIEEFDTPEEAYNKENKLIESFINDEKCLNQHFNVGNFRRVGNLSEETKQKMRKPKSEEHKRKISEARKGMKFSPEHIENMSKCKLGFTHTDEAKQKIREYQKSHKKTPEHIANAAAGQIGKKVSEETRRKQSEAQKKRFERERNEKI